MDKGSIVLEIARGDTIEALLDAGVIEPALFHCADGSPIDGYRVIGGTLVPIEEHFSTGCIAGGIRYENQYGFGRGQRPIMEQYESSCVLIHEVFYS